MTFRSRTLYQLSYNGLTKVYCRSHRFVALNRDRQGAAKTLVDREGFEPSYLARRDRFTVCWL